MSAPASDGYIQLLYKFLPRPIKSEEELLVAQEVIDAILSSGEITSEKQDYLNVLVQSHN